MTNPDIVRDIALDQLAPVRTYLDVISSSKDPNEVLAAHNLYHTLFHEDPEGTKSWEDYTFRVYNWLCKVIEAESRVTPVQNAIYEIENILSGKKAKSYTLDEHLLHARTHAITHVARSMIQGNRDFPVERFKEVIDMCVNALCSLDPSISPRKAKRFIRRELDEIWEVRSAEALSLVGAPSRLAAYRVGSGLMGLVTKFTKA